jgi:hypothetical protein
MQSWDIYSKLGIEEKNVERPSHKRAASTLPGRREAGKASQVRSPVNYDKQLPRTELNNFAHDVNPNRFVPFNHSPMALTNVKRVSSPNFSLYVGRKKSLMYSSLEDQPNYDPKFTSVWKNTERGLVDFSKVQGRKEVRPQTTDVLRTVRYTAVDKKVPSPLLVKAQAKLNDPVLPVFMLGNITRGNTITQKTLEMNCYGTQDYLPLSSSFGKGWTSHVFHAQPIRGRCPKVVKKLLMKESDL